MVTGNLPITAQSSNVAYNSVLKPPHILIGFVCVQYKPRNKRTKFTFHYSVYLASCLTDDVFGYGMFLAKTIVMLFSTPSRVIINALLWLYIIKRSLLLSCLPLVGGTQLMTQRSHAVLSAPRLFMLQTPVPGHEWFPGKAW